MTDNDRRIGICGVCGRHEHRFMETERVLTMFVAMVLPMAFFVAGLFQPVSVDVEYDVTTSDVLLNEGYSGIAGDGCECIYIPRWRQIAL